MNRKLFLRYPTVQLALVCLLIPLLLLLVAGVHGADGHQVDLDGILAGMSAVHPLGCDALGRDVLARVAEGLRLSMGVGVAVVLLGAMTGITLGIISGWAGGWVDNVLMRLADIVLSFPGILLAIALAAMLGPGVDKLIIALVAVGWVGFARLSRKSPGMQAVGKKPRGYDVLTFDKDGKTTVFHSY